MPKYTIAAQVKGLVLNRREGDITYITNGEEKITVEIVEIKGKWLRMAINAPDHYRLSRGGKPKDKLQCQTIATESKA